MLLGNRTIAVLLWMLNTYYYLLYWLNIYVAYLWISWGTTYWHSRPLPEFDIDNEIINHLYHRRMLNFQTLFDLHNLFSVAPHLTIYYLDERPGLVRAIIPKDTTNHPFGEIIAKVEVRRMFEMFEHYADDYEPEYVTIELSELLDQLMCVKRRKKSRKI